MVTFIVNGSEKTLKMRVNGIDISGDFIGNTDHGMAHDEDGNYVASQEDFDWWKNTIEQHQEMEAAIKQYKDANAPEVVDQVVQDWIGADLGDQPAQVLMGLKKAFGKLG